MKRDAVLNLRVPARLRAALERAAKDDVRTVSGMAVVLLMQGLAQRGYLKSSEPAKKTKR